jgi:DNA-binding transcriptional LysR family regulator
MDKLSAMRAFVRVVQAGSFSAVGRELNTSQASISKKVAALEKDLGTKLLTRSSRDHSLTQVGQEYYKKCVAILAELDEAEAMAREDIAQPRGVLRISAPSAFASLILAPVIGEFLARYPQIKVEMSLSEQHTDLIASGIDLAIRGKKLEDSNLIARHLFENPMVAVAAPDYIKQHSEPQTPQELKEHNCLVYSLLSSMNVWHFESEGKQHSISVTGSFQCDNGDTLLHAALAGLGIVILPLWMASAPIKEGQLVELLTDYTTKPIPFNAVYPHNRYVPLKVRTFIEFLKEKLGQREDIV